jgi:hypothetical protein
LKVSISYECSNQNVHNQVNQEFPDVIRRPHLLSFPQGYKLDYENEDSVNWYDVNELHSWREVSWAEYINEVLITKANDQCHGGKTHHVVNVEELSLQMAKEILSLPIIPSIIIQFNGFLILWYWLQFTEFGNNQKYNTALHPVEEEHDLHK